LSRGFLLMFYAGLYWHPFKWFFLLLREFNLNDLERQMKKSGSVNMNSGSSRSRKITGRNIYQPVLMIVLAEP